MFWVVSIKGEDLHEVEIGFNNIRREYMECYLSALFYFHQQGLIFDFLLPQTFVEKELFIENISERSEENKLNDNLYENIYENKNDENINKNNEENLIKKEAKTHQHINSGLDLGDQNKGFFDTHSV